MTTQRELIDALMQEASEAECPNMTLEAKAAEELMKLLATNTALEAEVVRLRGALETFIAEHEECEDSDGWMAQMCSMEALHVADEVMSTPFTPTALNELIEKVEKIWREKCAEYCAKTGWKMDYDEIPEGIRALPVGQIKLEELL